MAKSKHMYANVLFIGLGNLQSAENDDFITADCDIMTNFCG